MKASTSTWCRLVGWFFGISIPGVADGTTASRYVLLATTTTPTLHRWLYGKVLILTCACWRRHICSGSPHRRCSYTAQIHLPPDRPTTKALCVCECVRACVPGWVLPANRRNARLTLPLFLSLSLLLSPPPTIHSQPGRHGSWDGMGRSGPDLPTDALYSKQMTWRVLPRCSGVILPSAWSAAPRETAQSVPRALHGYRAASLLSFKP